MLGSSCGDVCVAACCSVLQRVAVYCCMLSLESLSLVAMCVLQYVAACSFEKVYRSYGNDVLRLVAMCLLQRVASCCSVLQRVAVCCSMLF